MKNFPKIPSKKELLSVSAWIRVKSKSWYKLVRILLPIFFGLYDEISDWIYYFTNDFYSKDIEHLALFFVCASPAIEFICWFIITVNFLKEMKIQDAKRLQKSMVRTLPVDEAVGSPIVNLNDHDQGLLLDQSVMHPPDQSALRAPTGILKKNKTLSQMQLNDEFKKGFCSQCCQELYTFIVSAFQEICSLESLKNYMIAFPVAIIIVVLMETKTLPFVAFALLKNKFSLIVTDEIKQTIVQKKYKKKDKKDDQSIFSHQSMETIVEDTDQNNAVQVWSNVDPPFYDGLLNDTNLRYLMKLGDITESVFEALPQSIIQFTNNNLVNTWGIFTITSFVFSMITVIIHSLELLMMLYETFVNESQKILKVYTKKKLEQNNNSMNVGKKLILKSMQDMRVLQYLNEQSRDNPQVLILDFEKQEAIDSDCMMDLKQAFIRLRMVKEIEIRNMRYSDDDISLINLHQAIRLAEEEIYEQQAISRQSSFDNFEGADIQDQVLSRTITWIQDLSYSSIAEVLNYQSKEASTRFHLLENVKFAKFKVLQKNQKDVTKVTSILKEGRYKKIKSVEIVFYMQDSALIGKDAFPQVLADLFTNNEHSHDVCFHLQQQMDEQAFSEASIIIRQKLKEKTLRRLKAMMSIQTRHLDQREINPFAELFESENQLYITFRQYENELMQKIEQNFFTKMLQESVSSDEISIIRTKGFDKINYSTNIKNLMKFLQVYTEEMDSRFQNPGLILEINEDNRHKKGDQLIRLDADILGVKVLVSQAQQGVVDIQQILENMKSNSLKNELSPDNDDNQTVDTATGLTQRPMRPNFKRNNCRFKMLTLSLTIPFDRNQYKDTFQVQKFIISENRFDDFKQLNIQFQGGGEPLLEYVDPVFEYFCSMAQQNLFNIHKFQSININFENLIAEEVKEYDQLYQQIFKLTKLFQNIDILKINGQVSFFQANKLGTLRLNNINDMDIELKVLKDVKQPITTNEFAKITDGLKQSIRRFRLILTYEEKQKLQDQNIYYELFLNLFKNFEYIEEFILDTEQLIDQNLAVNPKAIGALISILNKSKSLNLFEMNLFAQTTQDSQQNCQQELIQLLTQLIKLQTPVQVKITLNRQYEQALCTLIKEHPKLDISFKDDLQIIQQQNVQRLEKKKTTIEPKKTIRTQTKKLSQRVDDELNMARPTILDGAADSTQRNLGSTPINTVQKKSRFSLSDQDHLPLQDVPEVDQERIEEQRQQLYSIIPPICLETNQIAARDLLARDAKVTYSKYKLEEKKLSESTDSQTVDKYIKVPGIGIYKGQWKSKRFNGFGMLFYNDGGFYQGQFLQDRRDGNDGIMIFSNGGYYTGSWKDDARHGEGTYIFLVSKYVGQWYYNQRQGSGIEYFVDTIGQSNQMYVGEFIMDKRHGQKCTQFLGDGATYVGAFENGKKHGYGETTWPDGRKYEGQYKFDLMDGDGKFTWPDGRSYRGQYKQDLKHGRGTFIQSDGRKYSGDWFRGQQHGEGEESVPGYPISKGVWQYGKKIRGI